MTTRKVCCGPRKAGAGEGRETQKDVNNMPHREGGVKETETGSEAYDRYIITHILLMVVKYHFQIR
jgi:hypothetical protein